VALPLEGIRIIDCTIWQQGTYATALLADMGADVVKVEGPDSPDPGRSMATPGRPDHGLSAYFECHNRNKRGVVLDLKHPEGRETLLRLVRDADVFVQNMRKGVMERLGLAYRDLAQVNPAIIYASASGYGDRGPDRALPSMDIMGQARGGLISVNGEPARPVPAFGGLADQVGAVMLANGILVALVHRMRTGQGQEVDVSLLGTQIALQAFNITNYLFGGRMPKRRAREEAAPLWNTYAGSDGRWFVIGLPQSDRWWTGLCTAIGREDLMDDPRFSDFLSRQANAAELVAILDGVFAMQPCSYWVRTFAEAGLMCAPVQDYAEVCADAQARANEYIIEVDHPSGGRLEMVGHPIQFSATPAGVRRMAPEFGQHTEEVLLEAGLTWEEIHRLRNAGAVGPRNAPTYP
jgi:crotonobetainyl-CoA:carnitine CoA-transferase CaiB-like acyl-CoA transferase